MSFRDLIDACGTDTGYQRHRRAGERICYPCLQANARRHAERTRTEYAGPAMPDPRRVRNGLPVRPYVYRGTGVDTLTGCPSSYGKGCRCEDCRDKERQRHARVVAELAARPREQVPHGLNGYDNWCCRCSICKAAKATAKADSRRALREAS